MTFWGIILAAGSGTRLTASLPPDTAPTPKQFLPYHNAPLYWHSALTMGRVPRIAGLVFVFPAAWLAGEQERLRKLDRHRVLGVPYFTVAGGPRRQDSVYNALTFLKEQQPACQAVLVHDSARPFVSARLIQNLCAALNQPERPYAGIIPALPVTDTVKIVQDDRVISTPDRSTLRAVQTPQAFFFSSLYQAHAQARAEAWAVTDDSSLMELCHLPVGIVTGDAENQKLTHPEDLTMLHKNTVPSCPRTGFGYDVHRYGVGRPMLLGGILIPNAPEIIAHSDGDVVLHALMDALLACACLGDIGQHFPDTAPAYENISSAVLLDDVLQKIRIAGVRPVHVDITIIAQIPKVSPQRETIRRNVARLMGLDQHCVNIKATTEEGLGFTGAKEGIKAVALVTALHTPEVNCA
ncbi:MAG: 2-C-methyl-D-erythritol 4-phosphate cytidylyltransferase [Desulfovibrionaceae bacterium]